MFVCHNILYSDGKLIHLKSNSKYLVFHNGKISQQEFCKIIDDVFRDSYKYLVFDNGPKNPNNATVRTNVFPHKRTVYLLHFIFKIFGHSIVKINHLQ